MFCSSCGKKINNTNEAFCSGCGARNANYQPPINKPTKKKCVQCGAVMGISLQVCPTCGKNQNINSDKRSSTQHQNSGNDYIRQSKRNKTPSVKVKTKKKKLKIMIFIAASILIISSSLYIVFNLFEPKHIGYWQVSHVIDSGGDTLYESYLFDTRISFSVNDGAPANTTLHLSYDGKNTDMISGRWSETERGVHVSFFNKRDDMFFEFDGDILISELDGHTLVFYKFR